MIEAVLGKSCFSASWKLHQLGNLASAAYSTTTGVPLATFENTVDTELE